MAQHAPADVRRQQILEAALDCFADKGYHAARMDDIVQASGLSKGALYWHFKNKDEIFLGLFDRFEALVWEGWAAIEADDPVKRLRLQGEIVLTTLLASRQLLDAWVEFIRHPLVRERFARIYRESRVKIAEIVAEGTRQGVFRAAPPEHVAAAYTALVEGLVLQALMDPQWDAMAAWPESWEIFSRGLGVESH
jgi:AcrR family transcriptional regulator